MNKLFTMLIAFTLLSGCNYRKHQKCNQEITNNANGEKYIVEDSYRFFTDVDGNINFKHEGNTYILTDYSVRSLCNEGESQNDISS